MAGVFTDRFSSVRLPCQSQATQMVHSVGSSARPICTVIALIRVYRGFMQRGSTALMWAALNGHSEIVEVLLQYGARIHLQDHVRRGEGHRGMVMESIGTALEPIFCELATCQIT